jgi:hypothetical protein
VSTRAKFTIKNKPTQAWENLRAELRRLKSQGGGIYAKAGFLGAGGERPPEPGEPSGLTNAELAAVHEYGAPEVGVPARPFVGPAFDDNRERYELELRRLVGAFLSGSIHLEQALGILGLLMASDIRRYVTEGDEVPPPNAPATLARKEAKSSGSPWGVRTLVDTGRMIGSTTHAVIVGPKPTGEEG